MDDQRVGPRRHHFLRKREQRLLRVLVVDTDAAFDRHGHGDCRPHGRNALRHQVGLSHQAGAEMPALHAVRGTTAIEIDLDIALSRADARGLREFGRLRTAELHGNGLLMIAEADDPGTVAVDDGARRHHLRIEPRPARQDAMERSAMPVGPVHHGSYGEAPRAQIDWFLGLFNHFGRSPVHRYQLVLSVCAR